MSVDLLRRCSTCVYWGRKGHRSGICARRHFTVTDTRDGSRRVVFTVTQRQHLCDEWEVRDQR